MKSIAQQTYDLEMVLLERDKHRDMLRLKAISINTDTEDEDVRLVTKALHFALYKIEDLIVERNKLKVKLESED